MSKKNNDISGGDSNVDFDRRRVIDLSDLNALSKKKLSQKQPSRKKIRVISSASSPEILEQLGGKIFSLRKKFFRHAQRRELFHLACIALLIVFFFNIFHVFYRAKDVKNIFMVTAYEGFANLVAAGKEFNSENFIAAEHSLNDAVEKFESAKKELWFLENGVDFTKGAASQSVNGLLQSGEHLANAGKIFTKTIKNVQMLFYDFYSKGVDSAPDTVSHSRASSLTEQLQIEYQGFHSALSELREADASFSQIRLRYIPEDFRDEFSKVRTQLQSLIKNLETLGSYFPSILKFLGDRYPHRILVLFQNNNEIRPTGGFIGSFMIVDINDGHISSSVHDVYDFDGQLHEYIESPLEIRSLSDSWRMRDSNYSPDFSVSAQKVEWFLQKEKGPSVDTVIAFDLSLATDLLALTGPVVVSGIRFDSENFETLLSYIIESKLYGENSPKNILQSLVPALQEKLFSLEDPKALFAVLQQTVSGRHLQGFSKDDDLQHLFHSLGMDGNIAPFEEDVDYLNIIHSAIGGNKSDRYIQQSVTHRSFIQGDGEILNQLILKRRHLWDKNEEFRVKQIITDSGFSDPSPLILDILGAGTNVSATRIYVPDGAELIDWNIDTPLSEAVSDETALQSSSNLVFSGEGDRAVETFYDEDVGLRYFYTKLSVAPGEEIILTLSYRLPYRLDVTPIDEYAFYYRKQAGIREENFLKEIHISPRLKSFGTGGPSGKPLEQLPDEAWSYTEKIDSDVTISGLFGMLKDR